MDNGIKSELIANCHNKECMSLLLVVIVVIVEQVKDRTMNLNASLHHICHSSKDPAMFCSVVSETSFKCTKELEMPIDLLMACPSLGLHPLVPVLDQWPISTRALA